ncbi:MAG: hypothetical protein KKD18_01245 [Nanoarchaeota archaeon]|nr:hypothetical protein [Nanoarchaeota archaeon]MBU0977019.1 hypothetical protein [Nanoarchaeota archaeon]
MVRPLEITKQVNRQFPEGVNSAELIANYLEGIGYQSVRTKSNIYRCEGDGVSVELTPTKLFRTESPEAVRMVVRTLPDNPPPSIHYETLASPLIAHPEDIPTEWPPNVCGTFES